MLEIGRLPTRPDPGPRAISSTSLITKKSVAIPQRPGLRLAAMIGNFPPRLCGIATFTRDMLDGLISASPATRWNVVALDEVMSLDVVYEPALVTGLASGLGRPSCRHGR